MEIDKKKEVRISGLPYCSVRAGRLYDGKMVICCGDRKIEADECIECKLNKRD